MATNDERANDFELLEAWRAGDQLAGNVLLDRHFESVHRMFHNKVGSAVDDLVQRTFLACTEHRDAIRENASFRSYLLRVARNELYMYFRTLAGPRGAIDTGVSSVQDMGISPSSVAASRQRQERLKAALQELPLDLQVAIELYYWEDLSGPEMADVLGVAEGTVRSRIRRAIAQLEQSLPEAP